MLVLPRGDALPAAAPHGREGTRHQVLTIHRDPEQPDDAFICPAEEFDDLIGLFVNNVEYLHHRYKIMVAALFFSADYFLVLQYNFSKKIYF